MPWQEMSPMHQCLQFMADHQRGFYPMRELCARYAISRKTSYKWLARYATECAAGLAERGHAPHECPHRMPTGSRRCCSTRDAPIRVGPREARAVPRAATPARPHMAGDHTVADLLKRHALVRPRRHRRAILHPGAVPLHTAAPNDVWTADFKGSSAPATAWTATRSRSPISTRAFC
jgi:hypothetical protein